MKQNDQNLSRWIALMLNNNFLKFTNPLSLQHTHPTPGREGKTQLHVYLGFQWQCHPFLFVIDVRRSASLSATKTWNSGPSISSIPRFSVLLKSIVSSITSKVTLKPKIDKTRIAFAIWHMLRLVSSGISLVVLDLVNCCSVLFSWSSTIQSLASTCSPTQMNPLHPSIRSTPYCSKWWKWCFCLFTRYGGIVSNWPFSSCHA